jgi:hypothetical protein
VADDIVTRLRIIHCAADDLTPCGTCLICQAADEIERLRAGLQDAWSAADMLATQLETISSGNTDVLREYDMRREEAWCD